MSRSEKESKSTKSLKSAEESTTDTSSIESSSTVAEEEFGRLTLRLAFAVFSIVIGSSFQYGYHIGCINPPANLIIDWLKTDCNLDDDFATMLWTISVSAFCLGGVIGGLISPMLADKLGRKMALLFNNVPLILGVLTMMAARWTNIPYFLGIGRILIGINAGICSGVTSLYLLELSPINLRGTISSIHQLAITISILIAMIIGLPQILGTAERWNYIFGASLIFAVTQLITLPFAPESPKFSLVIKKNEAAAVSALQGLRGQDDVHGELRAIQRESDKSVSSLSICRVLCSSDLRWPLFLAVVLMAMQPLTVQTLPRRQLIILFFGINTAMFYSTSSFEDMGLSSENAAYATVGMGAVNVLMTIVSVWLVDHPRMGRRSLLLTSLAGMSLASAAIIVVLNLKVFIGQWSAYIACAMVFLFVISFATGLGSIPWFYINEIFPSDARAASAAIAVVVNWASDVFLQAGFLHMTKLLGNYTFSPFLVIALLSVFFVYRFLPETKGLTMEEIQEAVERKRPNCC